MYHVSFTKYSGGSRISHGGGGGAEPLGQGRRCLTRVLFGESVCENKRIRSHLGTGSAPGSANEIFGGVDYWFLTVEFVIYAKVNLFNGVLQGSLGEYQHYVIVINFKYYQEVKTVKDFSKPSVRGR